ncbi:MAG: hypothetical protein AB7G75_16670 [Candidatus Binatia bacterium]
MDETALFPTIARVVQNDAPVAICTALAWEGAAVRAVLKRVQREDEKVWRGFAGRKEVLVITTGIGPRRTQRTLEQFAATPLSAVFSVGCAGALVPGLMTGQLILASEVWMYAVEGQAQLMRFAVEPELFAHARTAAHAASVPTAEGALFTSAKILFTPEEKSQRGRETGAIAVEMESGVHAAFAAHRGVPFLVLRVILDGVGLRLPVMKGITTSDGEVRPLKTALHVATHPHHLPALFALKQARTRVSQTLSRLCWTFFSRLT